MPRKKVEVEEQDDMLLPNEDTQPDETLNNEVSSEEPVIEELVVEEPVIIEEPTIEETIIEEPVVEETIVEEKPVVEEEKKVKWIDVSKLSRDQYRTYIKTGRI